MKIKILLFLLFFLSTGCEEIFFKKDQSNTAQNNFEIFWNDFNMYYSQFGIRNMNWDSVYQVVAPQTKGMSDFQLFGELSKVVTKLNDMHVNIYTPYGTASWKGWGHGSYPSGKLINPCNYFVCGSYQNSSVFEYRMAKDYNVGYIIIKTFEGNISGGTDLRDDRYFYIDDILKELKNSDGIIIDVRWNGGGNSLNAETVASRFADKRRMAWKSKEKNGPGKNDFSDWYEIYIEPKSNYQFSKPVVVLTSRLTSSSAEGFVMYMKVLPNVTIIGDTTGGGTGSPIFRELPNGWTYRLSTAYATDAEGNIVDGKGITPDITIQNTVADSISGVDAMLQKGIETVIKN